MDIATTLHQIGRGNLLAISGGRYKQMDGCVLLPVAAGYYVSIELEPNDTYTVRRMFKRGAKVWKKGEVTDVYCDELGETCYRASCYHDEWGN